MIQTACPLDCFDGCSVVCDSSHPKRLVGGRVAPSTNGTLCAHLYRHLAESERIEKARIDGQEVSMGEALDAVAKAIADTPWLLWRGSGNVGVMQAVTNLLAKRAGGVLTHGTLCDGAGDAGIVASRGVNRLLPPEQIAKSEVVVIWGRNPDVTNSHILPYIEGKEIIVIDPRKTKIAKRAKLHLQIRPRGDFYLATLLSRFLMMEDAHDKEWLNEYASEYEEFYDFTRTFRIKAILEHIELSLNDIGDFLLMLQNRKVVFLVGAGVQRHESGDATLRAIDAFAALLGLFGREGCGVSYLANSQLGFDNPFSVKTKTEPIATTPFKNYKSVIVQGGNPAESMPCSLRVREELKEVENLIYFGLYENQTSQLAKIVIPAKNFLEKEDIRLSYGHQYMQKMNRVYESDIGVSEHDFSQEILRRIGKEPLKDEKEYIDFILSQAKRVDEKLLSPGFEEIPYRDGFGEDGGEEFEFIDDFYDDFENIKALRRFRKKVKKSRDEYWLLTPKTNKTINTQFNSLEQVVYLPKGALFKDGESVLVKSIWGELLMKVKVDDGLREDCVVIFIGTKDVNILTPPISSTEGDMACYGDVKVELLRVGEV
ncbi:MAG TPA: molybdopterin oxidoreductase [Nitratifractor sp.]|nr:molybdopterin oxidoreductase [Nitratifractor sp.]